MKPNEHLSPKNPTSTARPASQSQKPVSTRAPRAPGRTKKPTHDRLYIMCIVLAVHTMTGTSATPYTNGNTNASDSDTVFVTVFDGFEQWVVPLAACRLVSMSEDRALDILQLYQYNIEEALVHVELEMRGGRFNLNPNPNDKVSKLSVMGDSNVSTTRESSVNYRQVFPLWSPLQFKLLKYSGGR